MFGWTTFLIVLPFMGVAWLIARLVSDKYLWQVLLPVMGLMFTGFVYFFFGTRGLIGLGAVAVFFVGMLTSMLAEERSHQRLSVALYAIFAALAATMVAFAFLGRSGIVLVAVVVCLIPLALTGIVLYNRYLAQPVEVKSTPQDLD